MTGTMMEKPCETTALLEDIRQLHEKYPLCGTSVSRGASAGGKGLLDLEAPLLEYLLSLMRGAPVQPPDCTQDRWGELLSSLRCHWADPFLYSRIMAAPSSARPPGPVTAAFKGAYVMSTKRYLLIEKQLVGVAVAFEKEGIEALVLKGAALSRTVYPDPFVRPGSDLDILVRPDDVVRARKALETIGYQCECPLFDVSRRYYSEEKFHYKDSYQRFLPVEVHWDLISPPFNKDVNLDGYFERSVEAKASSARIKVMDTADALMYAAMHMAHHGNNHRLSWINDIALLCGQLSASGKWEQVVSRNPKPWAGLMLEPALRMAELWCGACVPPAIRNAWPAPDEKAADAFDNLIRRTTTLSRHLKASWPADMPLAERLRLLKHFVLPPERLLRENFFPGRDISLPAAHFKRWLMIAGWKFDH